MFIGNFFYKSDYLLSMIWFWFWFIFDLGNELITIIDLKIETNISTSDYDKICIKQQTNVMMTHTIE